MEDPYDETDASGSEAKSSPSDTKAGSGETALIPKSLCPGMKVGSKVTLTIEADRGEEYEVSYDKEPEGDEPEAGEAEPEPDPMME